MAALFSEKQQHLLFKTREGGILCSLRPNTFLEGTFAMPSVELDPEIRLCSRRDLGSIPLGTTECREPGSREQGGACGSLKFGKECFSCVWSIFSGWDRSEGSGQAGLYPGS